MRKLLSALSIVLACAVGLNAVPLDVPYQVLIDTTTNTSTIILSSNTVPSAAGILNANPTGYAWCIDRFAATSTTAGTVTFGWAQSQGSASTVDHRIAVAALTPYNMPLEYRTPYCAPVGQNQLTVTASVVGSTMTLEGYLFKGWNP